MTQHVSLSTSILAACARIICFHKGVYFYGWDPYLEIAVQYILLVKVRHALRDFVYHFQRVDSCGISFAQARQVLD
jgi:hypothetical protein